MEDHPVMIFAAANLGLEAVHKWTDLIQPVISSLVSLGQVAVAIVTVIYIIRKTNRLGTKKRRAIKKATNEIENSNS